MDTVPRVHTLRDLVLCYVRSPAITAPHIVCLTFLRSYQQFFVHLTFVHLAEYTMTTETTQITTEQPATIPTVAPELKPPFVPPKLNFVTPQLTKQGHIETVTGLFGTFS